MILAIITITLGLGVCVYMIASTIIELQKLNKKRDKEREEALATIKTIKADGDKQLQRTLDYVIKELEK